MSHPVAMPTWLQDVNLYHFCSREWENPTSFLLWNLKLCNSYSQITHQETPGSHQTGIKQCAMAPEVPHAFIRQVRTMMGTRAIEWALLAAQDTHSSKIFPFNSLFPAVLQFAITIKLVAFLCSSRLCNHSNKIINMRPILHFSRVQLWCSLFFECL